MSSFGKSLCLIMILVSGYQMRNGKYDIVVSAALTMILIISIELCSIIRNNK